MVLRKMGVIFEICFRKEGVGGWGGDVSSLKKGGLPTLEETVL